MSRGVLFLPGQGKTDIPIPFPGAQPFHLRVKVLVRAAHVGCGGDI
jgi:hypothetical protein